MEQAKGLYIFSGLKHSGKSSLARLCAQRRGWFAQDLDVLVAQLAIQEKPDLGEPEDHAHLVRTLFRAFGREVFQDYECRAVQGFFRQLPMPPLILSLGGGTMENSAAMAELADKGTIFFFDTPSDILFERIMRGGVPAFLDPENPRRSFEILYERRRALGRSQARHILELGTMNLEQAFQALVSLLEE